jgi:hypothetical protein
VNLYFEDESRFGLISYIGRCLTAKGVKPLVKFQHNFINAYLYGCFSPINGDHFIYEIQGANGKLFQKYLVEFSKHQPRELKIVIMDNAGVHSLKNFNIPDNIVVINIPPYSPELNPAEKIWQYIKQHFKNNFFEDIQQLKQ